MKMKRELVIGLIGLIGLMFGAGAQTFPEPVEIGGVQYIVDTGYTAEGAYVEDLVPLVGPVEAFESALSPEPPRAAEPGPSLAVRPVDRGHGAMLVLSVPFHDLEPVFGDNRRDVRLIGEWAQDGPVAAPPEESWIRANPWKTAGIGLGALFAGWVIYEQLDSGDGGTGTAGNRTDSRENSGLSIIGNENVIHFNSEPEAEGGSL